MLCRLSAGIKFQHTAARRRLGHRAPHCPAVAPVSTHSRPKAAGYKVYSDGSGSVFQHTAARRRLAPFQYRRMRPRMFQHTATRRRLVTTCREAVDLAKFQHTAARRRLGRTRSWRVKRKWFQHTAARRRLDLLAADFFIIHSVSTHSRPKAAGWHLCGRGL